jgi:hypothetical protein
MFEADASVINDGGKGSMQHHSSSQSWFDERRSCNVIVLGA